MNQTSLLKIMGIIMTVGLLGCSEPATFSSHEEFEMLSAQQQVQACSQQQSDRESTPFVSFDLGASRPANSGLSGLIADVQHRNSVSLNGQWQYLIDQLDMGDKGITMQGGVGLGQQALPTELLEYAFSDAARLTVPGDWNSQKPSLEWYRGVIWYKKSFNFSAQQNEKTFLYFDGAYLKKDIYLNGELIARHDGGFTAFNVDVSSHIKQGENALIIKVDSRSDPAGIPTEYNDWMNYGGLTRDISLVSTPQSYIQNYKIQLDNDTGSHIQGWVQVQGDARDVVINIEQAGIAQTIQVNEQGYGEFSFTAKVKRWSPQQPYRYEVKLSYASDQITSNIGFRTLQTQGEKILLNGQAIFLRGISMHEESLLKAGRANDQSDAQAAVKVLKDLNVNFVRLAHYQHNQHMIEAAEAAGILIWAELPIYHSMAFDNPCTLASAKRQFSEMIARDQNRAAIILWSISNETPVSEARNQFLASLANHVRSVDGSRLITSALFGRRDEMESVAENVGKRVLRTNGRNGKLVTLVPNPDPVTIVLDDPLGEIVDVVGYNQYLGWYVSAVATRVMRESDWDLTEDEFRTAMLLEMKKVKIESHLNKPIIISEFGAGAKQGFNSDKGHIWSEQFQKEVYLSQFELLKNIPDLAGISPWVLKDFRSPYRLNSQFQNYWNRKGLVSEEGIKKMAFHTLANYYRALENKDVSENKQIGASR